MSDFFRRASDAFHRQRQGSTDSTGAPSSPNAAQSPEEPLKKRTGSVQSESHVDEAFSGTATSPPYDIAPSSHRYPWGWKRHDKAPENKQQQPQQQPSQGKKQDLDWVVGT